MSDLRRGLYETLITEATEEALERLAPGLVQDRAQLASAEAPDRLALHVGRLVSVAVAAFGEDERTRLGVDVVRAIVHVLAERGHDLGQEAPVGEGLLLRSIRRRLVTGEPESLDPPGLPLLDTALLTNAPGEPRVGFQIRSEIGSADSIDVIMAFIRRSGIGPLRGSLERHVRAGRPLRILTTTYTGSTEAAALDMLRDLGARIRVSYDTSGTRLHAKAWLFHRHSGFSTAYIGSSNLTHQAQVTGLEWNVRVSGARNPTVVEKICAVFESYWESGDFVAYDADEFARRSAGGTRGPIVLLPPTELHALPFQARMLEKLALQRIRGHHRNLLVSATGTGKTVMAALDYASLCAGGRRPSLLFVAHRKEILEQSRGTFRHALRDPTFGELWVDGARPTELRHVFASVQSLYRADLERLDPAHFEIVVIDEFHHAAGRTYRRLLDHVRPSELLGLTATPERADGVSILDWFDGRFAAELRLWDAIDQQCLAPFAYYGVSDGTDLRAVPFRRGQGYDVDGLTSVYTASDAYARRVVEQLLDHAEEPATMRVLGFCVGVDHARFMARVFTQAGVAATAVWGDSPAEERQEALDALRRGTLRVLFSVDLFNEGVDLPDVDTLLLLRPTESATLFLQQLGRGLRKAPGKRQCLVLDLVGQHRREFRFDRRLRGLLGGSRRTVIEQVERGFPLLPAGCHMELDRVAREEILRSLREAIPSARPARVQELRGMLGSGRPVDLGGFLRDTGLDLEDVYVGQDSWSDLLQDAGGTLLPSGPHERVLRRAVGRMLHVDDAERLAAFRRFLDPGSRGPDPSSPERERRLARMLAGSLCESLFRGGALPADATIVHGFEVMRAHPQVCEELRQVLDVLDERVDHAHVPLDGHPHVPLQVHARYTRLDILAAFEAARSLRIPKWQSGVLFFGDARADAFTFTLDKTGGHFSPTTRYRDYAISRDLVHWESQSVTRADSRTGLRYQNHAAQGSSIHLFCRLARDDRAFWYLGPATYVRHQDERPMAITWRLAHPLPGDLFTAFAAAVA
ncbi:MAG: DUF3427 domain-containing protein [Deltaproteobacteria bacterium]|nr:DUF3427 domain-containing protein [Deltaproteobacteria bacterium]